MILSVDNEKRNAGQRKSYATNMSNVQQNEKQLNANRENNTEHKRNSRQSKKTFIA